MRISDWSSDVCSSDLNHNNGFLPKIPIIIRIPSFNLVHFMEIERRGTARIPDLPVVLTNGYSHVLSSEGTHGFDLLHQPPTAEGLAQALRAAQCSTKQIGARTQTLRRITTLVAPPLVRQCQRR